MADEMPDKANIETHDHCSSGLSDLFYRAVTIVENAKEQLTWSSSIGSGETTGVMAKLDRILRLLENLEEAINQQIGLWTQAADLAKEAIKAIAIGDEEVALNRLGELAEIMRQSQETA